MRVLVTGATGFIGNYVIRELLKRNIHVIATSNVKPDAKKNVWLGDSEFIDFDMSKQIDDEQNLFEYFQKPDKLIHLAWEGLPNYNEMFHIEKNLFTNYFFLKRLSEDGLNDITVSGTCLEYGMKEGCLTETMNSVPENPYAVSKDSLRKFLEQLRKKAGFSLKWVRLFYIFGKGQSEKSLYSTLEAAVENGAEEFDMSAGDQVRDFLPVEKVSEILVEISLQNKVNGIINCCSGRPVTVKQFVENYFAEKGKKVKLNLGVYPYPDYEPFAFWGDSTKLGSIINLS